MRRLLAVLLLAATPALAGDDAPKTPDYSRDALLRITREAVEQPKKTISFDRFGAVDIDTHVVRIHLPYTLVPPLQGSVPRVTMEWPNPFTLTNASYAMTAKQWARH